MKRTVLSVLALSGALVLGACGSADAPAGGTGSSVSQDVADVETGDTVPLVDVAKASAAAVKEKGTAHMTTTVPGQSGSMEADVDYSGDAPKMSMTMTQDGQTMEMVYLDKAIYMGGESVAQMAGGKSWIKISADGDDPMSQMMGPLLEQMESSAGNPAAQLEAYGDATATVKGVENGVTTYEVTLTKEQILAAIESQGEALNGLTDAAAEQMPEEGLTYTMSLDANALPVSMSMDIQGQAVEITYSKWGEPVDIAAPPADEVGTFEIPTS